MLPKTAKYPLPQKMAYFEKSKLLKLMIGSQRIIERMSLFVVGGVNIA